MEYLLGIDIGTTGTKTVLFDLDGNAISTKTVEYPLYQPQNGWAEQDPADWWNAVKEGIGAVLAHSGISAQRIRGIGLSGQMHGLVMLDKNGEVLRRSIIWCDQRTAAECAQMNRLIGEKRLIEVTANPALTGFTASKILWVQNNEPDLYARCAHILLPKDYIRYRLTGEFATEVSDACGMQLMDIPKRCWSAEVCEKLGIDTALLPKLYESPEVTGTVHHQAAQETGLSPGTLVVGGAGDNAAAAVGTGVVRQGTAFNTIGSSGVIYTVTDEVRIDPLGRVHTLCASVPGKWTVMSCTQAAGLSLKWLRDTCCAPEVEEAARQGVDPYQIMDQLAEQVGVGAGGLLYLPYLMGERSPHPNADCRGVFFGLSAMHGRGHMIRAVMEGVAYSQRECLDVFREMGVQVNQMTACGGGGRSPLWRQMLADLYGCPISTVHADEGPALGAAILAGVGAGIYPSVEEACDQLIRCQPRNQPIPENSKKYEDYYQLYKELYLSLLERFSDLAKLNS